MADRIRRRGIKDFQGTEGQLRAEGFTPEQAHRIAHKQQAISRFAYAWSILALGLVTNFVLLLTPWNETIYGIDTADRYHTFGRVLLAAWLIGLVFVIKARSKMAWAFYCWFGFLTIAISFV